MPSSLTALTMSQIRSRSLSFGLRQAAAMQNRLAPASFARRAVSRTASLVHQLRGFDAGVVMRALRTVSAVFRAAAGLDAEQARGLDVIGIEIAAMDGLRLKKQIREREIIKCLGFESRPIVARARGPKHGCCRTKPRLSPWRDSRVSRHAESVLRTGLPPGGDTMCMANIAKDHVGERRGKSRASPQKPRKAKRAGIRCRPFSISEP